MILEPIKLSLLINYGSFDYLTSFEPVKTGLDNIETSLSLSSIQLWFIWLLDFEPVKTGLDDIRSSSRLSSQQLWFIWLFDFVWSF